MNLEQQLLVISEFFSKNDLYLSKFTVFLSSFSMIIDCTAQRNEEKYIYLSG